MKSTAPPAPCRPFAVGAGLAGGTAAAFIRATKSSWPWLPILAVGAAADGEAPYIARDVLGLVRRPLQAGRGNDAFGHRQSTLGVMTWGQAFLRRRTKSGRRRLFRLWLEKERPELLHALLKLTPEAFDRIIEGALASATAEAAARN